MPTIPVDVDDSHLAPDAYCSVEDAKSAGASGSDEEITAAILEASQRVTRYTSELFAPTPLTIECDVDNDGLAHVRKRIQSVASVTWTGAPQPVAPTAYRVNSSTTVGGRDTIGMYGDLSWADVTVLGAEPWNGGWANLSGRVPRISIVGVFGWDVPPPAVRRATALIAARIRRDDHVTEDGSPSGTAADTEGNVLPVVPPFNDDDELQKAAVVRSRTTGVLEADAELAPYVREPVRFR